MTARDRRLTTLISFMGLCVVSLGLLTWVDRFVHRRSVGVLPWLALLADARVPSLLVCLALCLLSGAGRTLGLPRPDRWRPAARLALLWLVPTAFALFVLRIWVPLLPRTIDMVAFLVTGLLGEELLFRGALFELGQRLSPDPIVRNLNLGAFASAIAFGLSHFQYHGFHLIPEAWLQVGVNVGMGFFASAMRQASASLWPPILLHFCTNGMVLARGS